MVCGKSPVVQLTGRGAGTRTPDGTSQSIIHLPLNPDSATELRRRLVAEGPMPMAYAIKQSMYEIDASQGPATARGTYRAATDHGNYYGGHAVQLIG